MALNNTTIRDFGGGWNVSDSDINLESRYQPISDNVRRGLDGSISVRFGYSLYCDLRNGTAVPFTTAAYTVNTTTGQSFIQITMTAHGRVSGDHINITAFSGGAINGIPDTDIIGANGILVVDANNFKIPTRTNANATASASRTISGTFDNHLLAGNIIHMHYFNRYLIVWDDTGELAKVDVAGVATKIWDYKIANTLVAGLIPTRESDHVSSASFMSTVISCNGQDRDKPLQIFKDITVKFLADKASPFDQTKVPTADYVIGMHSYVIFARIGYPYIYSTAPNASGDAFLSISGRTFDGVFVGNASPGDATLVDLSMITDTVEPVLLGVGALRDKLYVGFYDRGMLGVLGVHDTSTPPKHTPDFEDTIAEHGVIAHRTIVPLGNDIFMCDYSGVPSVSISSQSGVFVPSRLSDLISPELSRHLSSLQEDTLKKKAFAVYNKTEREYMLFLPKYDETIRTLPRDPFYFNNGLRLKNLVYVYHPNHNLIEDSRVLIAGATSIGSLTAAMINGFRSVVAIADANAYIIQLDNPLVEDSITNGGGSVCTITPVNDETIGYIYEYNKELKIRRWTRYRQLDFDCGAVSQRGIIYFAKKGKIYSFGTKDNPMYADRLGEFDKTWANSTAYTADTRVKDVVDKNVYKCLVNHTSLGAGTFQADRDARPDNWTKYLGEPIKWAVETPWSDLAKRGLEKHIVYVNFDTRGTANFDVSVYSNLVRTDPNTYLLNPARAMSMSSTVSLSTGDPTSGMLIPARTMQLTGGDAGGWGIVTTPGWSSGRRTREDRVWPLDVRGKLVRFRYSGLTQEPLTLVSHTIYYFMGSVRR